LSVLFAGASAIQQVLQQEAGKNIRVFVLWERVLLTDWLGPSTATLKRISDGRAQQYWDKGRLLSKALGETDKKSIVWDQVIVYGRGVSWSEIAPPKPVVAVGPVFDVVDQFVAAIHQPFEGTPPAQASDLCSDDSDKLPVCGLRGQ
jgi:hypothetical protein